MTDRFVTAAELMSRTLGAPGYPFVVIPHPISSASPDALVTRRPGRRSGLRGPADRARSPARRDTVSTERPRSFSGDPVDGCRTR